MTEDIAQFDLFLDVESEIITATGIEKKINIDDLFNEYKERMEYWHKFEDTETYRHLDYEWWWSRYCEDHPVYDDKHNWILGNYDKQKSFEQIWEKYKDYFTRNFYAVIYNGGDIFINRAGKERETRYVVVKDIGENEAIKIMDAKNKFLPNESRGYYAYTAMWRLNYILSGHKDETGIERN